MKANKTILVAALAVGGLLVGSLALRAGDTNKPSTAPPAGGPSGEQSPRGGFERMADQLNLTAEQKPKVQAIMSTQRQKMLDLRNDTSLSPDDRAAKRKAVVDETAQQMKAVLTPEQFDKWQKTSPMGPRRPRPNGPPPGSEKVTGTNAPAVAPKK
jgi:periplasmic protein CpxP/Spy